MTILKEKIIKGGRSRFLAVLDIRTYYKTTIKIIQHQGRDRHRVTEQRVTQERDLTTFEDLEHDKTIYFPQITREENYLKVTLEDCRRIWTILYMHPNNLQMD